MRKTNTAGYNSQKQIHEYIMNHPGLHTRELSRQLDVPRSTLQYHLNNLEKQGFITTDHEGTCLHYYHADIDLKEKRILSILRKSTARKIVLFLLTHAASSQIDLSRGLEKHPTTIAFYLKKLEKAEVITQLSRSVGESLRCSSLQPFGKNTLYSVKQVTVAGLLKKYYPEQGVGDIEGDVRMFIDEEG